MMATFTAINCKHQTSGAMRGTLDYVAQDKKNSLGRCQTGDWSQLRSPVCLH